MCKLHEKCLYIYYYFYILSIGILNKINDVFTKKEKET